MSMPYIKQFRQKYAVFTKSSTQGPFTVLSYHANIFCADDTYTHTHIVLIVFTKMKFCFVTFQIKYILNICCTICNNT